MFVLFNIINAAITPGTQPHNVRSNTINTEPQPLSKTAKGGQKIAIIALKKDIVNNFYLG